MDKKSDIFPIIVLYCCKLSESKTYNSLLKNKGIKAIMVYDNSPQNYQQEMMPDNVIYIRDYSNRGISYAYNTAAQYAYEHKYDRLLVLDPDTTFPENALDAYFNADRKTTLWAPTIITKQGKRPLSPADIRKMRIKAVKLPVGKHSLYHYFPINSGMCISLKAYMEVGGYDENIHLDFSDFQFLRKLRQRNEEFLLLPTLAYQDFSNEKTDIKNTIHRYSIYIKDARKCKINGTKERLQHQYSVFLHTLSLTWRFRSYAFIKLYLS